MKPEKKILDGINITWIAASKTPPLSPHRTQTGLTVSIATIVIPRSLLGLPHF